MFANTYRTAQQHYPSHHPSHPDPLEPIPIQNWQPILGHGAPSVNAPTLGTMETDPFSAEPEVIPIQPWHPILGHSAPGVNAPTLGTIELRKILAGRQVIDDATANTYRQAYYAKVYGTLVGVPEAWEQIPILIEDKLANHDVIVPLSPMFKFNGNEGDDKIYRVANNAAIIRAKRNWKGNKNKKTKRSDGNGNVSDSSEDILPSYIPTKATLVSKTTLAERNTALTTIVNLKDARACKEYFKIQPHLEHIRAAQSEYIDAIENGTKTVQQCREEWCDKWAEGMVQYVVTSRHNRMNTIVKSSWNYFINCLIYVTHENS